jgi:hypothetical protein
MADDEAADQQEQLIEAQHQLESSKLPLFHANPKLDKFTVEQWVHRVELARRAGTWSEIKTSECIYRALRDEALTWYEGLEFSRVDKDSWESVKAGLLKSYGATATARTAILSFGDLNQKKNESITTYYTRVTKTLRNYQDCMPMDGTPFNSAVTNVQWTAVPADFKTRKLTECHQAALRESVKFMGAQLFTSGLKEEYRLEVVKGRANDLNDAFDIAREYERQKEDKTRDSSSVHEINELTDPELAAELEAVRFKHQQKRMFNKNDQSAYQSRNAGPAHYGTGTGGKREGTGAGPKPGTAPQTNKAKGKMCHYCKKKNHFQLYCRKRLADKAPCVEEVEEGEEDAAVEELLYGFKTKTSKN